MSAITISALAFFEERFQKKPERIFLSPGRINIIGEHVDYNNGYVLPAAIDKYVCIAISKTGSAASVLISKDLDERYEFDINEEIKPVPQMWANYFLGIILLLKESGHVSEGIELAFTSTVPIGAGLSSSAAVECCFAFALNEMFNFGLSKKEIALLGRRSENTFVGVQCGIMDQFASVFGKENNVIRLDCDTLEYDYHEADLKNYTLLLLNSNVKHTHLTSGYNDRRKETTEGLAIIQQTFPAVKTFRDCSEAQVEELKEALGPVRYKRCRFVVQEIQRVREAVEALENGDLEKLGRLMLETHRGLSEDYEVSCAETDFLVDAVRDDAQVAGARMMGGGFGGCTINLVEKDHEDELVSRVAAQYKAQFNVDLEPYKVKLSEGTHEYK